MSLVALEDDQAADDKKASAATEEGKSGNSEEKLAEINNKLNNPGADVAQLSFKFEWTQFEGRLGGNLAGSTFNGLKSLRAGNLVRGVRALLGGKKGEGPSSQDSLSMLFQPVVPFALSNGDHIIVRPTIPVVWQPRYNGNTGGFDEDFGIGDAQLNVFYSKTDKKKGLMYGAGMAAGFPTHTDNWLGKDQFTLGPAAYLGTFGKWGSVGVFPQHLWNIKGAGGYTSQTAIQLWYWFNVGHGYQLGGSPLLTANWNNDDSDDIWSIPVNLGVGKTIRIGKLPVKFKFETIYYLEQPDSFGPHWGVRLTITPVIPNPFERKPAKNAS